MKSRRYKEAIAYLYGYFGHGNREDQLNADSDLIAFTSYVFDKRRDTVVEDVRKYPN